MEMLVSSVLFSQVYEMTVGIFPGAIFFVMAGTNIVVVVGFLTLVLLTLIHEHKIGPLEVKEHI